MAPGNRAPRSYSTIASLLASTGKTFRIKKNGLWQEVRGFTGPREFDFPQPVGRRKGYLVDVPDHDLFPKAFGASTVEFRAGAELPLFNLGGQMLSFLVGKGIVRGPSSYAGAFQNFMKLFGSLGTDAGAIGVEVVRRRDEELSRLSASIVAEHHGHKIPVMPAVIMTKRWLQNGFETKGCVNFATWLDRQELEQECGLRGYKLHVKSW